MSTTLQRIKEFIDYKGITNQKFEQEIGFSNGAFASQLKNNRTIGVDKLENILIKFPDVNSEWLLTGNGEMLKNGKKDVVKLNNTTDAGIPLIPIDAMAGFGAGTMQIMDYDTSRYIVPEFHELNVDFMIRVKGKSMEPAYNNGDLVACRKLHLSDIFFQWNKVYVLDTEQGAIIKRVKKGKDQDHILLISDNIEYDPFDLHLSKINSIGLVVGAIRLY